MGAVLPFVAIGSQALGLGARLLGGIGGAMSARSAAAYQAQVAKNNLKIAKWNANLTRQEGEVAATNEGLKGRAELGALAATQAASGVDINSGSAVDVRSSASRIAQLNAMTIKSDSARRAYGFDVQAKNYRAEEKLARASSPSLLQSFLGVGSSVLGGASSLASSAYDYSQAGALDFGGGGGSALAQVPGLNSATGMLGSI